MDSGANGVDRGQKQSGNDYNQSHDHTASSRSVSYRHRSFRQGDNPPHLLSWRTESHNLHSARPFKHLTARSVNPTLDFHALITQKNINELVSKSDHFGRNYNGIDHSMHANAIKHCISVRKRRLSPNEQSQLEPLLMQFQPATSWTWRNLTTVVHSLVSAGVFTPCTQTSENLKKTETVVLPSLFDEIIRRCKQKPVTEDFDVQGISNLLWAGAKLVDSGLELEKTPKLQEAVAALLPHVKTKIESKNKKDNFNTQGTCNLLWALAKLVNNGLKQETTPELKETVHALLQDAKTKAESKEKKDHFIPKQLSSLLWAMAKLVDNGLELKKTPVLTETVAALYPHVKTTAESKDEKEKFDIQGIINHLWAFAKLTDNGLENTPELKEIVITLLYHVKTKAESQEWQNSLGPRNIASLLWAIAKLVDNGLKLQKTPHLKEAVVALLPYMKTTLESKNKQDHFNHQGTCNLTWALAKLVVHGLKLGTTPKLKATVSALLQDVKTKAQSKEDKDYFIPQHLVNLLWAMATLAENGLQLEKAQELKEVVTALSHHVKVTTESKDEKDHFSIQGNVSLLWALAKLGELVELNVLKCTVNSLVHRVIDIQQLIQQDAFMYLWGIMAFCARLSLESNANQHNLLEERIKNLFTHLEHKFPGNKMDQSIMAIAASWLQVKRSFVSEYQITTSRSHLNFQKYLQVKIPSLKIEKEVNMHSLPPVDLLLPDYGIVIEIQGPSHYVCGDFQTRNGSTLLKVALLQRLGYKVIEIPVNKLTNNDSMDMCVAQIKTKIGSQILAEGDGSVSPKSVGEKVVGEADDAITNNTGTEWQTVKSKKNKRKARIASNLPSTS